MPRRLAQTSASATAAAPASPTPRPAKIPATMARSSSAPTRIFARCAGAVLARGDDPPDPPARPARGERPSGAPPVAGAVLARGDDPPDPPARPARGERPSGAPPVAGAGSVVIRPLWFRYLEGSWVALSW